MDVYTVTVIPPWPFQGAFVEEDVFALVGARWRTYLQVDEFYPVPNRHPDPKEMFLIYREDVASIPPAHLLGYVHRHPKGFLPPSPDDIAGCDPRHIGAVWCEGTVQWFGPTGPLDVRYAT